MKGASGSPACPWPQQTFLTQNLNSLLQNTAPVANRPSQMGELFSGLTVEPPSTPGSALPNNLSLVVYLDPNRGTMVPNYSVFNEAALPEGGGGSVSILELGTRFLGTMGSQGAGELVQALSIAGIVNRGVYSQDTLQQSVQLGQDTARTQGIPIWQAPEQPMDFTRTQYVDRVGLEQEASFLVLSNQNGTPLDRCILLASTEAEELGMPVFKLETDAISHPYPELITAPLRSNEYMNPELDVARKILLNQFTRRTNATMADVIDTYNAALIRTLGEAGRRYYLHPNPDVNLGTINVRVDSTARQFQYSNQETMLMPYANVGSRAFIDALPRRISRTAIQDIQDRSAQLISRLGESVQVTPELRAFAFQLFFDIYHQQSVGGENVRQKTAFDMLLRFSSEDVVYSILSDENVQGLHAWYRDPANRTWLFDQFREAGMVDSTDLFVHERLDNILSVTAESRMRTGRAQLESSKTYARYSRVPDETHTFIRHSHPSAESRRPFVFRDGRYYAAVEYRSNFGSVAGLARGAGNWLYGPSATLVRQLAADIPTARPYDIRAYQFSNDVTALLTRWASRRVAPDAITARADLAAITRRIGPFAPPRDSQGRLEQSSEGWWRQIHRTQAELESTLETLGVNMDATEVTDLRWVLNDRFGVDPAHPPADNGSVWFENNSFHTWRGPVTAQEIDLPQGWRPGMDLDGFEVTDTEEGAFRYTPTEAGHPMGKAFTIAWNGQAWPTSAFHQMEILERPATTSLTFTPPGETPRTLDVPTGYVRLDETHVMWTFGDGPRLALVADLSQYEGFSEPSLAEEFHRFAQMHTLFSKTQAGRVLLQHLQDGAADASARFAADTEVGGLSPSLFQGREAVAMVVRLGTTTGGWARETALDATGLLRVLSLDTLGADARLNVMNYIHRVSELELQTSFSRTGPMPDGQYRHSISALTLEQAISRELGLPLRSVIDPLRVENLAPMDGSVLLAWSNHVPISPAQRHQFNLIAQELQLARQVIETAGVDTSDIPYDIGNPWEALSISLDRVTQLPGGEARTTALRELRMISRTIADTSETIGELNRTTGPAQFRTPAQGDLPTAQSVMDMVRAQEAQLQAELTELVTATEAGPRIVALVQRELMGLDDGLRAPEDVLEWLKRTSQPVRDMALSHLLEIHGTQPVNPDIHQILLAQESRIMEAFQQGTLSDTARQILAVRMEQVRLANGRNPDMVLGHRLELSPEMLRYILEFNAPYTTNETLLNNDGSTTQVPVERYESVTTSLEQGVQQRTDLARTISRWDAMDTGRTFTQLETILETGRLTGDMATAHQTFLTRVYDRTSGSLKGVALAVQTAENGPVDIVDIATRTASATLDGQTFYGLARAVHQSDPNAHIRFTPNSEVLRTAAANLLFQSSTETPFFSSQMNAGDIDIAASRLESMQNHYMDWAFGQVDRISGQLYTVLSDTLVDQLAASRSGWETFKATDAFPGGPAQRLEAYFNIRRELGAIAEEMSNRGRAFGTGLLEDQQHFLELFTRTDPNGGFRETASAYVQDSSHRIIVEFGNDPITAQAANFLAGKHDTRPIRYRVNKIGQLELLDGTPVDLPTNTKILLVGHGAPGQVGGYTADEIMDILETGGLVDSGDTVARISVVACTTDNPSTPTEEGPPDAEFGKTLIQEAQERDVTVDSVSSRSTLVMVDETGRKWLGTPSPDGESVLWQRGGNASKTLVERLPGGELEATKIPVGQGILESRPGTTAQALGPGRTEVVRFFYGIQVDENGLPINEDQALTEAERALVVEAYGNDIPMGTVSFEAGAIRIVSTEDPTLTGNEESDAQEAAEELIEDLYAIEITSQEMAQNFQRMPPLEKKAVINLLLEKYGRNPDSEELQEGIRELEEEIEAHLISGTLDEQAQFVTEILMEHYRTQRTAQTSSEARQTDFHMTLKPEQTRLAVETIQTRAPVLMRVAPDGSKTIIQRQGAAFSNEIYALNTESAHGETAPPLIDAQLRAEIETLVGQWLTLAREQGRNGFHEVYESTLEAIERQGIPTGRHTVRPTNILITRDPEGNIAAIGVHSETANGIKNEYFITDARLRISPRPAGDYWVGAGHENLVTTLREINARYPGRPVSAHAVNSQSHHILLEQYFSEQGISWLVPPSDPEQFEAAAQSLLQKKGALMAQALTELETLVTGHGTSEEQARVVQIRSRLTQVTDRNASPETIASFQEIEADLSGLRRDIAATGQALRIAHPETIGTEQFGSNIRYVDQTWRPTSDALHATYTRLLSQLRIKGVPMTADLTDRAGTIEDFTHLIETVNARGSAEELGLIETQLQTNSGETELTFVEQHQLRTPIDAIMAQRAGQLSALLEEYGQAPTQALADTLADQESWILKFYRENRLNTDARLTVETLMERVRLANLDLTSVHDAQGGNGSLYLDTVLGQVFFDSLTQQRAQYYDTVDGVSTPGTDTTYYRDQTYTLTPDITVPDRLNGAVRDEIFRTLTQWREGVGEANVNQETQELYRFLDATVRTAVATGYPRDTVHLVVTRGADGQIAAFGLYQHNHDTHDVWLKYTATNPELLLPASERGNGRLWRGAGTHSIQSQTADALTRYPNAVKLIGNPQNVRVEQITRSLFYGTWEQARLFTTEPGAASVGFSQAQRSLIERESVVLNQAIQDLVRYNRETETLTGAWADRLAILPREMLNLSVELDDADEASEVREQAERFRRIQYKFSRLAKEARRQSLGGEFEESLDIHTLELVDRYGQFPEATDSRGLFDLLAGALGETGEGLTPHAPGSPEALTDILAHMAGELGSDAFARNLSEVFKEVAAGRVSPEAAHQLVDTLMDLAEARPTEVVNALGQVDPGLLRDLDMGLSLDTGLAESWNSYVSSLEDYWARDVSRFAQVEVENLQQSGQGESFELAGATPAQEEGSRLVMFNDGEPVDQFGLPFHPENADRPTDEEIARVREKYGFHYTGRVRIAPHLATKENPGDLSETNPELADRLSIFQRQYARYRSIAGRELPTVDVNPKAVRLQLDQAVESALNDSILTGKIQEINELMPQEVRAGINVRARTQALAESIADAAAIRMEVERDHFRLMKAVTDQVDAQNARTGEDWVLDPDSIVFDGDEVRFQVVRRSAVEQLPSETAGQPDEYRIPDTAERVRFTVNTEGLLKSKAILETRKAQAEQLNRTAFDAEGNPRTSVLSRGIGYATTAGGLALAGVGLLQAIRGIEDSNSWQAAYGITASSYFAGHAGVGILAQAAKSGIGKAIISGATELVDVAGEAAIKGIAMATGRAVEEVAEIAAKAGATALRAGASVAGVLGEIIPFAGAVIGMVMMGMDAYNLFTAKTDMQRIQYGVDLVMDGALTVIDLIGAAFPPAQIVTAPLSIVVGVVRMIFDSAMVHIAEDLDALPENATTVQKVNAVFQGIVEGVVDLIKNLTPWGAVEETHKIMEQHAKDLAYINALNDPTTYFGIHPVDGVTGEKAIDFQVGDNSMLGGGITAVVGDPGQLSTVTVSGVPENQLTGSSGNLSTHSVTWQGLLPGNTDYFVLGFGASYDIEVTEATAHLFWAIPVHSETVIAGMTANNQNLFGNYTGNNRDNVFLGPLMSNFQYHSTNRPHRNDPRPLQTDAERRKQLADMRATLSVYHYELSGNGGNDTFIVGGGHASMTGGSGADTYVIKENIQFVIDNEDTSPNAMIDTLSLGEIALENLELGIKAADHTIGFDPYDYTPGAIGAASQAARYLSIGTTARTTSEAPHRAWYGTIDNFLSGSQYQHLQLRTSDGYMVTLDGEYFSGLHRRNTFFYTVRDQDIKGIYLQGRTSADFDARNATADVLVGGSGMADLRFRSAGYATGWYTPYLVNRAAQYNTLNLTHLTYLMGDDRVNTLHGNTLDNFITGGGTSGTETGGFDRLYGHQGNDILKSGTEFADNTYFYGGEGDDTHIQSSGWGRHKGGEGADRYVIERGNATFYIHENADDSVNSVKLDIAYDELRAVRLTNGALFIQQTNGNTHTHRGTLFGWSTEGVNYEVTTKDGWILGKNADGTGFEKIGFEASTHGDYIREAVAAQVPEAERGFTVTTQVTGQTAATARVSEINFFGGRPTTYTFDMGRAEAILQWFYDLGVDFGVHPAAWVTVKPFLARRSLQDFTDLIRDQIQPPVAATGLAAANDIIGTLREGEPPITLPLQFLQEVPNSHRDAPLSDFFGDTGLGTTAVDRAVSSTVTGYVWLEAGRHDFRLASSMLSRLRVDGELLLVEGHGVVEKDAQKMIRYASFETETAGYHAVELTYRQGTGQVQLRDDARRSYAREEHYLSLEVQTNNGPVQILGRGDHTPMANLNAFPSGLRDLFAGRNPRNGVFIDQNFENGTLVRISGTHLDDRISGNALDNILSGGGGNDILMGRGGADIYSLDGDSVDTIRNFDQDETMDTTYIDANRSEISLSRTGTDDLGIYVNSHHIGTVENWFRESAFRHMLFHTRDNQYLQYVTPEGSRDTDNDSVLINIAPNFADAKAGVSHTLANGLGAEYRQSLTGSDHDDMLTGNDFANRIAGLDGNDTLRGGAGNDQLFAGRGNDILVGGEGTDSYILTAGDGDNTIRNTQTGEEMNILRIYADKDDITLTRSGNHLRAATGTGEDAVSATVENWFIDATVRHLMLFTDDGYLLTPAHDTASGTVPYTAMSMDLRHATQGQTVDLTQAPALVKDVTGSAFADTLIGDEQDNLIIGNGGADTLRGGGGSDTYIVERDAGTVTIDNTARDNEQDMIVLNLDADTWTGSRFLNQDLLIETSAGTSVRLTDYRLYERARDVLLSMNGSTYRLDESGQRNPMNQDLSQQTQGQTLTLAAGASGARGSEYNDHLTGNALDNHLDGGEGGMDVLSGRNGADVYGVDIEMITSATRVSSLTAASTEIQAAGGRLILVDDQGTDEQVGTLQLREGSLSEVKTLRVGNHLYIYRSSTALADLTPGGDILIPAHAVGLPHWFANATVRHMVIADDQGFTADILDDGSIGPVTVINDGNQDGVTRDLSQGNAFRSVVKISDSPGNDTYTGNDKDNLFVLSQGARETVTGGNGQDTYYITDLDTTRRITLTNGGQDGKTDIIYVNDTSRVMNFSGYGTDTVHMQIGEVFFTLNVDSDQEEAPFSVVTTDGFTYKVMTSGRLVVDTVDISQQTTEVLDLYSLTEPRLATYYDQFGWTSRAFYVPRTAWGAKTLRGGINTRLLGGDDNDNTFIVLNTRDQGVTLRGRGGSDVYMTGATGTYIIDNQDTTGAQDTLNLMHDFNDLIFTRDNDDLLVVNQGGSFSLRLLQYMSQADDGDQYRHLSFVSQDNVGFTVTKQAVEPGTDVLLPLITALDLSDTTEEISLDLGTRSPAFGNAYMAVSKFVGSKTSVTKLTTGNGDTAVTTGFAADTITSGDGRDIVRSGKGNDQITTGRGDDMIFAGTGDDHVEAGDGDDVLIGNKGADWLYGGSGSDSVLFDGDLAGETGVVVNLLTGKGQGGDAEGDTYVSIENVYGTWYQDELIGNNQANVLSGGAGFDTLVGHGGNDIFLTGEGSANSVDGGEGSDLIRYADFSAGVRVDLTRGQAVHLDAQGDPTAFVDRLASIEDVEGSKYTDTIIGNDEDNRVLGSLGTDTINLGAGTDVVDYRNLTVHTDDNAGIWVDLANAQPVVVAADGSLSAYLVQALSNVETVYGSSANDRIYGTANADVLAGYKGLDILRGRGGNDTFYAWGDGDAFYGGTGTDTVDYLNMAEGVVASLRTGHGQGLDDFHDIENLSGTLFNDVLEGNSQANFLYGGLGLDVIRGLGGNDTLMGIGDGDLMDGGDGIDTVTYADANTGVWVTMGTEVMDIDQRHQWEKLVRRPDFLSHVETVVGSGFGDLIETSTGSETIRSGQGNDWIIGSMGSDTYDGGEGTDTVSFTDGGLTHGVEINLGANTARDRHSSAFTHTLRNIEQAQGSEHDDRIIGNTTGNDLIFASQGQDRIEARTATVVDFSRMYTDDGIAVSVEADSYEAEFDILDRESTTRITGGASIKGSYQDDTFTGGNGADHFQGGKGNDVLDGGTGSDVLDGGEGNDSYRFERGDGFAGIIDASGKDTLVLERYSVNEVAFWMDGKDLMISAGTDSLRVYDQVSASGSAVDRIRLSNGMELTASGISGLVSAMARFDADNDEVSISSAQDVRNNSQLMSLSVSAWQ